jgi:hypothetical protein
MPPLSPAEPSMMLPSVEVPPVKGPTDLLGGIGRLLGGMMSGPVVLSVVPPGGEIRPPGAPLGEGRTPGGEM